MTLTVRKITGRLLEREGYRVITAKDGRRAGTAGLTASPDDSHRRHRDAAMDGFDLTRNIRADARLKAVLIIMITSPHGREAQALCRRDRRHYPRLSYDEDVLPLIRDFVTNATPDLGLKRRFPAGGPGLAIIESFPCDRPMNLFEEDGALARPAPS